MEKKIILWTSDLATGITWQDYQHLEFLRFTNNLFDDFYSNKGAVEIDAAVLYLERYAKDHFNIEERYMNQFKYAASTEHKAEHRAFQEFINNMKDIDQASTLEGARLCNKLNNWFVNHIQKIDTALGEFLKQQGQA